jgi:hypothetical protein
MQRGCMCLSRSRATWPTLHASVSLCGYSNQYRGTVCPKPAGGPARLLWVVWGLIVWQLALVCPSATQHGTAHAHMQKVDQGERYRHAWMISSSSGCQNKSIARRKLWKLPRKPYPSPREPKSATQRGSCDIRLGRMHGMAKARQRCERKYCAALPKSGKRSRWRTGVLVICVLPWGPPSLECA